MSQGTGVPTKMLTVAVVLSTLLSVYMHARFLIPAVAHRPIPHPALRDMASGVTWMVAGLVLIGVRTRRRWILRGSQVLAGLLLIQAAVLSYWQWVVQGKTMAVGQQTLFVITLWLGPTLWMWYSARLVKMMRGECK